MRQKGIDLNHDFYVVFGKQCRKQIHLFKVIKEIDEISFKKKFLCETSLKQINNKRQLVNLYKDIVLVTRLHIFCTALFTNNNIKVVIQIDAFLAHHSRHKKKQYTIP